MKLEPYFPTEVYVETETKDRMRDWSEILTEAFPPEDAYSVTYSVTYINTPNCYRKVEWYATTLEELRVLDLSERIAKLLRVNYVTTKPSRGIIEVRQDNLSLVVKVQDRRILFIITTVRI